MVHYSASFGIGKQDGRVRYYVWDPSLPFCKSWLCLGAQSCPTLCDPVDCSLPGFSVHGDSPGKNTGVGCHALLQGIFPTRGSNPSLLHCRQILYCLSHQGSPRYFPYQPCKKSCSMWSRSPSTRVHETSFKNANLNMFPRKKFLQWLPIWGDAEKYSRQSKLPV